jgi:hypothetical protein
MNKHRKRDNLFGRSDSGPLPPADWYVTTETIAWRKRLVDWIEDQRQPTPAEQIAEIRARRRAS